MNALKDEGRMTGFLYLVIIICGIFSEMYVRTGLIVPGDAAATARNIMASEWLFRAGFVSDIIMLMSYLLLGLVFYKLLKSVNKNLAFAMLSLNLIGVPIMAINMLNHFAPLLILGDADYLKVFEAKQLQAMALLFLNLHKNGYLIATVSFGSWLLPLGYLVFRSAFFPKILGIMLMIASFGYLIEFVVLFLFPDYEEITYPGLAMAAIAEISFCLWLLVKGVKVPILQTADYNDGTHI